MKASLALIAVLILSLPALAVPNGDYYFEFGMGGKSMGREAFHVESFGDTLVLQGETDLTIPRPQKLQVRTLVHLPDLAFISSMVVSDMGDTLLSLSKQDSVLLAFRGRYQRDLVLPAEGSVVPMDNAVAQHIWLLAQRRHEFGNQDDLLVLVPQAQYIGPLAWRESQAASGYLLNKPIDVQRQGFGVTGILSEMDITEDGELMAFRVPLQGFEVRRADYRFSETSGPATSKFRELELTIEGGGPALGGTLTLPDGDGPFPALVMLQGSGPMDRDETVGPNRIFFDLAQGLAERGVASLRYDKRTWVYQNHPATPDSILKVMTLKEEVVDDAVAAYKLLLEQADVDKDRCFILGHSLGAMGAPLASRRLEREEIPVKGLILLAPPARDLLTLMLDQYGYLNRIGVVSDEQLKQYNHFGDRIRDAQVGLDEQILGSYLNYWDSVVYQKPLRNYQAQDAPALMIFGDRDYQVPRTDRALWRDHVKEYPREATRIELLPGLNHLFLKGEGDPNPEEYGRPGHVDPQVLDLISDWLEGL